MNSYSDHQIWEILDKISLKEGFIQRNGLDFQISENGENLSVGERQLLSIARSILKKSKIVLIDEATANIDISTEENIQNLLDKELKNCTVLVIAHRLHTIINSDKIVVLEKGKIVEVGVPKDLLAEKGSQFREIWNEVMCQNNRIN